MRRRGRAILMALLLLGCTIVGLDCSADRLILGENHDVVNPGSARRAVIRVDGRAVEYWVKRSPAAAAPEPRAFVLFFIGKAARADAWLDQVAQSWNPWPVEVWAMNYPGSGGSDGPVRVAQVSPDAVALFDAARAVAGNRPIFVQGVSFGTTAALSVAARRPVAGVVLQNPPPLKQLILGKYGWFNLWLLAGPIAAQVPRDLDSVDNAARSTAPVIFILSDQDQLIPPKYHEMIVNAYAGPKRVIHMPTAGHDTPLTHDAAEALARDKAWLFELTSPGGRPNVSADGKLN